ncbi:hypothetical protein TSH20_15295 [Azospirillum sp. TSH20]|nr:hypothetical protein TSH20_15295 [Azospirillum sp. TSH20]
MPKAIDNLPPVIHASEENGDDQNLGALFMDAEVDNEFVFGHRAKSGTNPWMLGAAIWKSR